MMTNEEVAVALLMGFISPIVFVAFYERFWK